MQQMLAYLCGAGLLLSIVPAEVAADLASEAISATSDRGLSASVGNSESIGLPTSTRRLSRGRHQDLYLFSLPTAELILHWRGLVWGSEVVELDGRRLTAEADYLLDQEDGRLRLRSAALPGSVLQVIYQPLPYLARPNLLSSANASEWTSASSTRKSRTPLSTRLARELRPSGDNGALGPYSGQRIRHGLAIASAPAETVRTDSGSGLRLTELQESLTGPKLSTGTVSYFKAEPTDPLLDNAAREEFNNQLTLYPSSSSRLFLSNYFARESLFTENYSETERRRLQFEQSWGKSVVGLLWDYRRADGTNVTNSQDTVSLSLTHPFSRSLASEGYLTLEDSLSRGKETESFFSLRQMLGRVLSAQASVQYRTSEFFGDSVDSGFTLSANPGKSDVTLNLRQSDTALFGKYQRLGAEVRVPVSKRLQFLGEYSDRSSERLARLRSFGLGMAARPDTRTLLQAAFSQSMEASGNTEQSHTIRFSADPSAALQIQLGYDLLSSSLDGVSRNALWMVTVGGQRYVRVEGYSSAIDPTGQDGYLDSLYRVEVRPFNPLAVSGHLRRVALDEDDNAVAGIGANLTLIRGVNISGTYRRPTDEDADSDLAGRDVRLTLAPVSGFRLFGQYSIRPEDERGALLDQVNRSVGLQTQLGSFALEGSLTRTDGFLAANPGQQVDLLASLSLGGRTRLYGGLRTVDGTTLDDTRSRIYRLGISQNAGQSFFLLLEGQLGYLTDMGGSRSISADDSRAQARFGVRF